MGRRLHSTSPAEGSREKTVAAVAGRPRLGRQTRTIPGTEMTSNRVCLPPWVVTPRHRNSAVEDLVESPRFVVRRHSGTESVRHDQDDRFRALMVLRGQGIVRSGDVEEHLHCGETLLVCAERAQTAVLRQSGMECRQSHAVSETGSSSESPHANRVRGDRPEHLGHPAGDGRADEPGRWDGNEQRDQDREM